LKFRARGSAGVFQSDQILVRAGKFLRQLLDLFSLLWADGRSSRETMTTGISAYAPLPRA
jgi:hypothetical protein